MLGQRERRERVRDGRDAVGNLEWSELVRSFWRNESVPNIERIFACWDGWVLTSADQTIDGAGSQTKHDLKNLSKRLRVLNRPLDISPIHSYSTLVEKKNRIVNAYMHKRID